MKKNITINLFGCLYAIDEDAYELLNKYIDNLRSYFGRQEGGIEIAEDIERRIAELFDELKQNGNEAISIEQVQEIISRIGKPEEMDDGNGERESQEEKVSASHEVHRKLYRDTRDGMVGGVLMGFSHYFGGDVKLWRIAFLLLCIIPVFFKFPYMVLAYVISWIVIPEAVSAEDYLRMLGKPITPDSIGETVMNADGKNKGRIEKTLSFILKVLFYSFIACILLVLGMLFIFGLIVAVIAVCSMFMKGVPYGIFADYERAEFVGPVIESIASGASVLFWVMLASILAFVAIPFFCGIHHVRTWFNTPRMSVRQRLAWCGAWVVSLLLLIGSAVLFADKIDELDDMLDAKNKNVAKSDDGYVYKTWKECYYAYSNDMSDAEVGLDIFLKDSVYNSISHLHFARTQDFSDTNSSRFSPGIYRITVKAFSNRDGLTAFVQTPDSVYTSKVPYGSPDRVTAIEKRKASSGETYNEYRLLMIPAVVIDSVEVSKPCELKYGIQEEKGRKDSRFVLYSGDYKMERIK